MCGPTMDVNHELVDMDKLTNGSVAIAVVNHDHELVDVNLWNDLKRLSSLAPGDRLFSIEEQQIFDAASIADRHATVWLKTLWIPVAAFCAGAWFSSATNLSLPVVGFLQFMFAVISALVSYLITGWIPHIASQKANRAQNLEAHLTKHFERLATCLVSAALDHDLRHQALLLARAMDIRLLRERAVVETTSKSDDLIDPLEDSVKFTLNAENDPMLHVSHMPWHSPGQMFCFLFFAFSFVESKICEM